MSYEPTDPTELRDPKFCPVDSTGTPRHCAVTLRVTEVSMRSFLACFLLILGCGGAVETEPEPEPAPEPSGGRRIATDADPPGPHSPLGLAGAGGQTTR